MKQCAVLGLIALGLASWAGAQPTTRAAEDFAQRRARSLAFYRGITVEAYDRIGRRDPKWDEDARQALEAMARICAWEFRPDNDEYDIMYSAGRRARDAGCGDPLVLMAFVRGHISLTRRYVDVSPMCLEIARRLAAGDYHPLLKVMANIHAGEVRYRTRERFSQGHREAKRALNAAMEQLANVLADPSLPREDILELIDLIGDGSAVVWRDRSILGQRAVEAVQSATNDRSVQLSAQAQYLLGVAQDVRPDLAEARGRSPDEATREFAQKLQEAAGPAEQAWQFDNSNSHAAQIMLEIAVAQNRPREQIDLWFERAVSANPNRQAPYHAMLGYLQTVPEGRSQMLALGRKCLQEGNWEAGLPLVLVEAHLRLAGSGAGDSDEPQRAYFTANADAWADVRAVYEDYLNRYPQSVYHRSRYAQIACWAGQHAVAARQFEAMGDRFSLTLFRSKDRYLQYRSQARGDNKP